MTYIITTQCPTFGRGYFLGFDSEEQAHFQSCLDKRVKRYKTRRNAEKQLSRIADIGKDWDEKPVFNIEEEPDGSLA